MRKQKGITLISLIITIILMIIVAGTTVYTSTNRFKVNNLKKMQNDLSVLEDKINTYYLQYGGLPIIRDDSNMPIQYTFSSLNFDKNVNDNELYYIIDLEALGDFALNYGREGYEKINTSTDVYIINEKTHTIYYVQGVEYTDGKTYHTNNVEEIADEDIVPPTKPQINVVSGDKIDENNYETNVTLEFIPGKNNSAGVQKTTYIVNGNSEQDISTLEKNQYTLNQMGVYEITLKTYGNNGTTSEITQTIFIGRIKPLEYLESTGTQYIDTGYIPNANTTIRIYNWKYIDTNTRYQVYIGSISEDNAKDGWSFRQYSTENSVDYQVNGIRKYPIDIYSGKEITMTANKLICEGTEYILTTSDTSGYSGIYSIYLFGCNLANKFWRGSKCRIGEIQFYDDHKLVCDLIPILDSNLTPCMYDKLKGKFYYNQGTGTFKTNLDEKN